MKVIDWQNSLLPDQSCQKKKQKTKKTEIEDIFTSYKINTTQTVIF